MIPLDLSKLDEVVVLGAHCDDVAIGAGATLLNLARQRPRLRVTVLVMTGGGSRRESEERAALAAFLPDSDLSVTVLNMIDGRLPEHWGEVKSALDDLSNRSHPDVVLTPQRKDAHQDHRLLGELTPTAFRDHLILGYEIVKWESDLPQTNVYLPLAAHDAHRKVYLLSRHYTSQLPHDWFDDEVFLGLMRLRGAQCHNQYAEAFMVEKIMITGFLKGY